MYVTQCRYFSGYKPCGRNDQCDDQCPQKSIVTTRVLVVHLEALGAVLRATSILPAIHRKFPGAHVTWVTQRPAQELLKNNPLIDRVLTTERDDLLALSTLKFNVAYCLDKSQKAFGVLQHTRTDEVYGFGVEPETGAIIPLNLAAHELWNLGLDNPSKFFVNQKPETQLMVEALEIGPFVSDEYVLELTTEEKSIAQQRRSQWSHSGQILIGVNAGCSSVIPYKKLSIEGHRDLIERLLEIPSVRVVLLGGGEDTIRNQHIAHGLKVVSSPTERGIRDGLASIAACDIVITGDSLGMHMAIALKKWVVAWFGPTCAQEIDLYERGVKVKTQAPCSPCWKRTCQKQPMCYDLVNFDEILSGVEKGMKWLTSSSKLPSSETSSSVSL